MEIFGTTSTGNETVLYFPGATRIMTFNVVCKSQYEQWWPIPSIHSENIYHIYVYTTYDATQARTVLDCGSAMKGQPYIGYIEYI